MRIVFRIEIEIEGDESAALNITAEVGSDGSVEVFPASSRSIPHQVNVTADEASKGEGGRVELIPDPNHRSDVEIARAFAEAVQTGRVDPGTGRPINPLSAESIRRTLGVGKSRARMLRDGFAEAETTE